jgi:hypothetical protein
MKFFRALSVLLGIASSIAELAPTPPNLVIATLQPVRTYPHLEEYNAQVAFIQILIIVDDVGWADVR